MDKVVNVAEERAELAKTPNAAKQLGIHLDASLTIQIRKRFTSVLPATTEALRLKFSVMSYLWLLAKMRQPACHRRLHRNDMSEDLGRASLAEELSPDPKHCRHTDDRTQARTLLGVRVSATPAGDQPARAQRFLFPLSLVVGVPTWSTGGSTGCSC